MLSHTLQQRRDVLAVALPFDVSLHSLAHAVRQRWGDCTLRSIVDS